MNHVSWVCIALPSENSNVTHRLGFERFEAAVFSLCHGALAETQTDRRVGDSLATIPRAAWSMTPSSLLTPLIVLQLGGRLLQRGERHILPRRHLYSARFETV